MAAQPTWATAAADSSPSPRPAGPASSISPPFFPTEPTIDHHAPLILLHHFTSIFPTEPTIDRLAPLNSASSISPPSLEDPGCPKSLDFTTFPRRTPLTTPWPESLEQILPEPDAGSGFPTAAATDCRTPIDPAK